MLAWECGCVIKTVMRSVHFISKHSLLNNVEFGEKNLKEPKLKANLAKTRDPLASMNES